MHVDCKSRYCAWQTGNPLASRGWYASYEREELGFACFWKLCRLLIVFYINTIDPHVCPNLFVWLIFALSIIFDVFWL